MPWFAFVSLSTDLSISVTDLYKKVLSKTPRDPLVMSVTPGHNAGLFVSVLPE